MALPKFLALLSQLDKSELTAFGKYLKKHHSGEKVALGVFGYFKKFHPEFEVDLETASGKIFGGNSHTAQPARKSLLNSFTDLHGFLKNYLLLEKLADGSPESEILWITVLRRRNMEAEFRKAVHNLFDRIKAAPRPDSFDYMKVLAVHYLSYYDLNENKQKSPDDLLALDRELETFYNLFRLKIDCEIMNWQKQGRGEAFKKTKDPAGAAASGEPLQILYNQLHDLLAVGGENEYLALEASLARYAPGLSREEVYTFYSYLKNNNIIRLRDGDESVWEKSHRLDKFALKHHLLLEKNRLMTQTQFFNIVNAAGMVKEFRWAERFIQQQIHSVDAEVAYETQKLCEAILLHAREDYGGMMKKLNAIQDAKTRDFPFIVRYRSLRLIGMYELNADSDALFAEITNFRAYLKRNRASGPQVARAMRTFVGFFNDLLIPKKSKEQLETEMNSARPIYYGAWLKKKLEAYSPLR